MKRITNLILFTTLLVILGACGATSEQSSSSPTPVKPVSSPSTGQQPGKMYYTVSGSTITVHNTPNGEMKEEMDFPTGASGARKSLYILDAEGNMTKDTIDIEYDRSGVKSVTMKGVTIPRKG